ncbi:OsmC family protein [Bacteriovorax sp. PP10]|uniref:OsmC family protein n=1 Tax=Bacteriovorax antarcticus TaxID=3088717 RepID=A0ABU5VW94_9BACT|nr:OsmC family protein [Bacteriovorax sp. PP10]MEA9357343.1 OsmC family protein [Bacteriovorax sp. PP10]
MITATRNGTLGAISSVRDHQILSGTTKESGGDDEGMSPHELLEAALASCTIITVQMYANRKTWPLESTDVVVTTDSEGATSHLTREITFKGNLDEEQKTRLLEIANKCPIHKLLTSHIEIETILKN